MAEPVGLASDLLTLATFAFKASLSLYETVNSFRSHTKHVHDLIEELKALSGVLALLQKLLDTTTDENLSALKLPLQHCGNACSEFEQKIIKYSSRSANRTSFRDWAKLQYLGDDIDGFRQMLSGYKLTINVALTDANLCKSPANTEAIEGYKDLIETAKADLEARLEAIDDKLQLIVEQTVTAEDSNILELRRIKEKYISTEKCLQICTQSFDHIDQIQLSTKSSNSSAELSDSDTYPERVTDKSLQNCKNNLAGTITQLEKHMQDLTDRLLVKSKAAITSEQDILELNGLQDDWQITHQCMEICHNASELRDNSRIGAFKNCTSADLSPPVVVSTLERLILENKDFTKPNSRGLLGGKISDESLQMLRDRMGTAVLNEEQLKARKRSLELEHIGMEDLTDTYVGRGRLKEAKVLADKSGTDIIKEATFALDEDNDPSSTTSITGPASTYMDDDRLDETEQLIIQKMDGRQRVLGSQASRSDASSMPQSQEVLTQPEESSFAATTLLDIQEQQMLELKPSTSLYRGTLDTFEDEDSISVVSDDNDIASKTATRRTKPEVLAIRHIASFLYELEELRPLHEQALKKLGPKRFQENYRRILKFYVLKLRNEAQTTFQIDIFRVLKSRLNRVNVARQIIDLIQDHKDDNTKPLDRITSQPVEKQSLEDWIRNTHGLPVVDTAVVPKFESHEQFSDENDSEDAEDEYRAKELLFPNITHADKFLYSVIPFQALLLELRLLVLPASLREVVESTPKHLIHVSAVNDTSLVNMAKAFIEDHTAFEWDWWPLMPRVPELSPGRMRLQWSFCGHTLYREISPEDAVSIQQVLELVEDHPSKCFCCETKLLATKARRANSAKFLRCIGQSITEMLSWKALSNSLAWQTSQSTAHQRYTPGGTTTSSASSGTAHGSTAKSSPHYSAGSSTISVETQAGNAKAISVSRHGNPSWVVFGIKDMDEYDEIENIESSNLLNDPSFFKELKKRHAKHRWFFQRWFSPFRFRYCKFVQFESINFDQVYSIGEALPDEHGYTSDYEYRPRPPRAENPLIDRKRFSICLQACDDDCYLAYLPSFLHKCRPLPHSPRMWERIPRKKGHAFDTCLSQPGETAFGIEAHYEGSIALIFFYHVILISSAFSFWIYWLNYHPGDLQNASVPSSTVLALIAAFWGIFARRTDIS